MKWLHRFLCRFRFYQYFIDWTKVVILPGFRPLPLHTVAKFFIKEIQQESLVSKASSLAYFFMLALFPAIIFLFTLIPYIPVSHFQDQLIELMSVVLPYNAYSALEATIKDIIKNQNGQLLSVGFASALYFASNGVYKLMQAFNKSSLIVETRPWLRRRIISLTLTVVISFSLLLAIAILIAGQALVNLIERKLNSNGLFWTLLLLLGRWIIVILIFFSTLAILYRYGPAHKRDRWKLVSPGAILATFLAVLTSLGFTYYIDHFSSYNKVYGSIGTLIVVMIWLYINSLIILIGFELNASIELSKRNVQISKPRFNTFRGVRKSTVNQKIENRRKN
ncbi:YihY/virulence factor BrkB family protein [Mucilaginibacter sp. RS28]|uniref:YihY/virulence factor BrkB family protein n=1 Tax=Mucilaginibacter straminoryzae TaxID=2932774 RepID=A0A9X1X3E3_9SPHI|nr:YihY/virulence factor BrkB family protein [Mucilaginibacter straminoryzae]MCJ8209555.1 YihY/virulence factor BrkB family protein [Mucilaginibacter straminoryzae]